jgi:hypothetical protein
VLWPILWLAGAVTAPTPSAAAVRIGNIRIVSNDVFAPEEAARGGFYRLANAIHIETRESFIRRQLLFKEGENLDLARLAETERNLRALPFIKLASVTASRPLDGVSDVLVVTQDAWTTQIGGSLGSKGGRTTYSAQFEETNFLGEGPSLSFGYDQGSERISRFIFFEDPYLFRPFWSGKLHYSDNSDGRHREVEISRPFFSFLAPWTAGGSLAHRAEEEKIYKDGVTFSTFHRERRERKLDYGQAPLASESEALRWTAGIDFVDDDFRPTNNRPSPLVPDRRSFRYLYATGEIVGNSFLTLNHINRDSRYEDFNLAPRLFIQAGISPRFFGAPVNSAFVELEGSTGFAFGDEAFAQADLDLQSRFDAGQRNTILSGFLGFARRFSTARPLQTFLARLQFDYGWRLDRDVQFAADGLTGLRGYRLHAFTGDKRLVFNAEQRFFSGREILQLVSPGAAVFFDAGAALPRGVSFALERIHADAGVGLRFGIARAGGNNVLRMDAAYAFDRDPRGRQGWLVSFSSSQAFSFRRTTPSGQ